MLVCGIDQSFCNFAVCFTEDKELITFATIKTTPDHGDVFERTLLIKNFIIPMIEEYEPDVINIEGLAFAAKGNATRDKGILQGVLVTTFMEMFPHIPINIITPTSLKKQATGSGRSDKQEMIDTLPDDVLQMFKDEGYRKTTGLGDLADAFHLSQL